MNKQLSAHLIGGLALLALSFVLAPEAAAVVVPNTASGDIAGNAADLNQVAATINLDVTTLGLVKAAFLTDGTQLASGAQVAKGTRVRFLIYVDNPSTADVANLNVTDPLAASFGYVAGTIKVDTSVLTGATQAAIYASANGQAAVSDAVDGDTAGYTGGTLTVSAGLTAGNGSVTVPRGRVWAMLFEVVVQ